MDFFSVLLIIFFKKTVVISGDLCYDFLWLKRQNFRKKNSYFTQKILQRWRAFYRWKTL